MNNKQVEERIREAGQMALRAQGDLNEARRAIACDNPEALLGALNYIERANDRIYQLLELALVDARGEDHD